MIKFGLLSGGAILLASEGRWAAASNQSNGRPTGGVFDPPSPPVANPFAQELRRMPIKAPLPGGANDLGLPGNGGVAPNGTVYPQITGDDALTTYRNSLERIVAQQQRNSGNNVQFPPKLFYALDVRQAIHTFHSDPPYSQGSIIWGYDGIYPGPTFVSRYGVPILVRIINGLYFDDEANPPPPGRIPGGFGDPRISTHLHNGHTASESDGNPTDIYPPTPVPNPNLPQYPESIQKLAFRDHHYAMFRAGLDPRVPANMPAPNEDDGDIAETVCTLWYHDHSMDFTAQNTYKGLVGFHLLFDDVDSGNENDPAPGALRLPSGDFDIPLLIQDKRFVLDEDQRAQLFLPSDNDAKFGVLGDIFVVNGQIQPKLTVSRRKYRFRLLNAGPSRFYQLFLTKDKADQPFIRIGNDESLLERPYRVPPQEGLLLSVAERADVVIDFSNFADGDELFLVNRLVMEDQGFGPKSEIDTSIDPPKFIKYVTLPADESQGAGDYLLRFDVRGDSVADPSRVPDELRANPALPPYAGDAPADLKQRPNHRKFVFDLTAEGWVINGRPFDPSPAGFAKLAIGSLNTPRSVLPGEEPDGEVWTIKHSGGWAHPVHIHLEEFRILRRNGEAPPAYEQTKKDVLRLDPLEEVQIFLRFRDFLGKYPIHCHNVSHEDHEMMLRFDVVGDY